MTDSTTNTLKQEIKVLRQQLAEKEKQLNDKIRENTSTLYEISPEEICRYSRQMIMPQITLTGQKALKNSKVLIVGIGGLGCPCALYLSAAGVGEITLVDNDEVELSNLHRQILHKENSLGIPKVFSAYQTMKSINSNIKIIPMKMHVNSTTIKELTEHTKFDVVIDGSDNVPTRYLINDICVLKNFPLVSGSALQMEGQLTVYNYKDGPCYRCIFPRPPPPETVTSCGDGGVLGVVPGIIGVLQALETIKIITGMPGVLAGRLLIFDGSDCNFRNVTLRQKNFKCAICGPNPTITDLIDYEQFCGAKPHDKIVNIDILEENEHVHVEELFKTSIDGVLLDVRPELEYSMCHLSKCINIPFSHIEKKKDIEVLKNEIERAHSNKVYVICRRGNDSQRAIHCLKLLFREEKYKFFNVKGGLHAYSANIDQSFPVY